MDQLSEKDWLEFINAMGMDPKDLPSLMGQENKANEFFASLEQNISEEISSNLDITLPNGYVIDKYRIEEKIGQGGMAQVYLAGRSDNLFQQKVAIKILSPLLDTDKHSEYFNAERQLLADLNHPNIGKIYDGGITQEGLSYFVMEYVEGRPVDEFCKYRNLSESQRLRLVSDICDAVLHAHNNLILHGDLKPSNVLVTENGQIKLLDFGVGKYLETITEPSQDNTPAGATLNYASPEQLNQQKLNTQSDIYQIGVLMYEILAGHHPYSGVSQHELADKITTEEFPKFSGNKDLSAIISTSTKKDLDQRYRSVADLIQDVVNYLNKYPVSVNKNNWVHTASLFFRRNVAVVSLVTLLVITSISAAVVSFIQKRETEQEKQKVLASNRFLSRIFDANDPDLAQGEEITAAELLRASENEISDIEDPIVRAYTQSELGQLYKKIGLWKESGPLFFAALDGYLNNRPSDHQLEIANAYNEISGYYRDVSDYRKADSALVLAINILEPLQELYPGALGKSYSDRSKVLHMRGEYEEGELHARKAIKIQEELVKKDYYEKGFYDNLLGELSGAYNYLSSNLREQSRYQEALQASEKAVEIGKQIADKNIRYLLIALNNLSLVYDRLGQYDKAIEALEQRLDQIGELYSADNPMRIASYANLGSVHYKAGNKEIADSLNQLAYKAYLSKFGPNHNYTVSTLYNLANSKYSQSKYDEAEQYFLQVLKADINNLGERHPYVGGDYVSLGMLESSRGNHEKALDHLQTAYDIYFEKFGEEHQKISYMHSLFAQVYLEMGNKNKSIEHYQRAVDLSRKVLGEEHKFHLSYKAELDSLLGS